MWQALSKRDSMYFAGPLLARGATVAAVEYELAPHASVADMAEHVAAAVRFLHAQQSGRRIYLVGHSAGGHLAALMLWRADVAGMLAGVVAASGLFDLADVRRCYANDALQLSSADVDTFSPTRLAGISAPVTGASDVPVPVLLAFAEHDPTRFREQSVEFGAALLQRGGNVAVREYAARDHFDLVENLRLPEDPFTADVMRFVGL
jgi:arylformamidase